MVTRMKNDMVYKWMKYRRGCYLVDFHDGVKTHPDGSAFYDLRIAHNQKELKQCLNKLISQGYKEA
jgi:hypothetical protein